MEQEGNIQNQHQNQRLTLDRLPWFVRQRIIQLTGNPLFLRSLNSTWDADIRLFFQETFTWEGQDTLNLEAILPNIRPIITGLIINELNIDSGVVLADLLRFYPNIRYLYENLDEEDRMSQRLIYNHLAVNQLHTIEFRSAFSFDFLRQQIKGGVLERFCFGALALSERDLIMLLQDAKLNLLQELTILDIRRLSLNDIGFQRYLINLRELILTTNSIGGGRVIFGAAQQFLNLKVLILVTYQREGIIVVNFEAFNLLSKLTVRSLLTELDLSHNGRLQKLRTLYIGARTFNIPNNFNDKFPNLKNLIIKYNGTNPINIQLSSIPQLTGFVSINNATPNRYLMNQLPMHSITRLSISASTGINSEVVIWISTRFLVLRELEFKYHGQEELRHMRLEGILLPHLQRLVVSGRHNGDFITSIGSIAPNLIIINSTNTQEETRERVRTEFPGVTLLFEYDLAHSIQIS